MYNEIIVQGICITGLLVPFGHYLTSACQQGSIAIALQHFLKRVNFKLPQVILYQQLCLLLLEKQLWLHLSTQSSFIQQTEIWQQFPNTSTSTDNIVCKLQYSIYFVFCLW